MARPKRRAASESPQNAGIREIAEALGVSIGTVDRALHNRPRISPVTRARVLAMADRLGYRPNLAARYLASQKERRIALCLPREIASFYDQVREGVLAAAGQFASAGVRVVQHTYRRLGYGEAEAIKRALDDDVHGLLLAPGQPDKLLPLIKQASSRGIPVVCVSTDAPDTPRMAAITIDPVISGRLVGELMGRFLQGRGRVVVVTGSLATLDHAGKLEGFRQVLRTDSPKIDLTSVLEAHDDEDEAYAKCHRLFARQQDLAGVYVSTANSLPVLRAIRDHQLDGRVTLITTDLFPGLVPFLESGTVAATIHQRAWTQGQLAFQTLYRYLAEGVVPRDQVPLAPHVIMKSNLPLFIDRLPSGAIETVDDSARVARETRDRRAHAG